MVVETSLGVILRDLPLLQKWEAAQEFFQIPPAWKGKANLQTMKRETQVMARLDAAIRANSLPREAFLTHPDLDRYTDLVERMAPSHLKRRDKLLLVQAVPTFVVGRWRESLDTLLYCFVRKARLLRANLDELEGKALRDASLSLLERSTPQFQALNRTILTSLESGRVAPLARLRPFVAMLERVGFELAEEEVYYDLLSGRGGYVRKMTHRLVGLPWEAHDPRAQAVVEAMREVTRFAPFRSPVPEEVVATLGFLQVSPRQLRRRKVFEPVVAMTLADLLWSGRVTVPGSRRYRHRWKDVPPSGPLPPGWTPRRWVKDLRRRLNAAGSLFLQRSRGRDIVREGRLYVPRPGKDRAEEVDEDQEEEERPPSRVRLPHVSVVDLLWEVDAATGFLEAFQLPESVTHRLPDDERRRLAIAVILALGLNLGLDGASRALGRGYARWRLRNFAANYMTEANLREAIARVARTWDGLRLGEPWGTGSIATEDGCAIRGTTRNLLSQRHYRKQRVGVVLYWTVRDDWLPVSVRVIGSQEWESWFVIDDLVRSSGGPLLEVATGDTHGQHLGAWGLAGLAGKRLTVRFRQIGQVKIYGSQRGRWCGLEHVGAIEWGKIRRAAVSLHRLAEAAKAGRVVPSEMLRMLNLYDEEGVNVAEGLRELGKVERTEFLLTYATNPPLREQVHRGRQRMEAYNSFQQATFFGRGGQLMTNNPSRWREIGQGMQLLQMAILFHNVWKHGDGLRRSPTATPMVWGHVELMGRYRVTKRPLLSEKRGRGL